MGIRAVKRGLRCGGHDTLLVALMHLHSFMHISTCGAVMQLLHPSKSVALTMLLHVMVWAQWFYFTCIHTNLNGVQCRHGPRFARLHLSLCTSCSCLLPGHLGSMRSAAVYLYLWSTHVCIAAEYFEFWCYIWVKWVGGYRVAGCITVARQASLARPSVVPSCP